MPPHSLACSSRPVGRALIAVVAACLAYPSMSRAQVPAVVPPVPMVLDFEPLSTAAGCGANTFTAYGGLAWTGWGAINREECGAAEVGGPRNGYWYGTTSGRNTGYIQLPLGSDPFSALSAQISISGTFDLLDAWLSAAWTTGLHVTVTGYNGTTTVGTRSFMLDYLAPVHAEFNLFGLTSAHFATWGGVPRWELGGLGNILVMDDLSVVKYPTVIPEPATVLLLASGLLLLGAVRRRRPSSA